MFLTVEGPIVVDKVRFSVMVRVHTSLLPGLGGHRGVIDLNREESVRGGRMLTLYLTLAWVMM